MSSSCCFLAVLGEVLAFFRDFAIVFLQLLVDAVGLLQLHFQMAQLSFKLSIHFLQLKIPICYFLDIFIFLRVRIPCIVEPFLERKYLKLCLLLVFPIL